MRKYFVYELKKSAFVIACLTVIALVIYLATVTSASNTELFRPSARLYLAIPSSIGGVLAACVPFWVFHYKMKKRSVDMFFSLPLSHTKVLAVKFLLGLVAVFLPYTLSFWLGAFVVMGRAASPYVLVDFHPVYYLALYASSILPILFLYVISSFVYTRANTMLDGILFVLLWAGAAALIAQALYEPTLIPDDVQSSSYTGKAVIYPYYYFPFAPLDFVTVYFHERILVRTNGLGTPIYTSSTYLTTQIANMAVGFALTALCAAGAAIGLFVCEKRVKAENAEQVSNSLFGYKVMIPLYTVCLMTFSDWHDNGIYIFYVLIAAGSFMMTALYKRTMKIGKIQAIVYFASLAVGLLLSYLCWM